ncbi:MAG: hypothetical protein LBR79_00235 [Oscillospiraceae bacterium]|jgi:UDP-N-acetylglucosamine transferase subunit ALG13|nr:hypothetical protein [Oscillospiraceae bacterium]
MENKQIQLAYKLVELNLLENYTNTDKIFSKVSKEELIQKFSNAYPEFFAKHKAFILDYIKNHVKFEN